MYEGKVRLREEFKAEGGERSKHLQDDTFRDLESEPKSLITVQVTVRFAAGTTVILCVIFPSADLISSGCTERDKSNKHKC